MWYNINTCTVCKAMNKLKHNKIHLFISFLPRYSGIRLRFSDHMQFALGLDQYENTDVQSKTKTSLNCRRRVVSRPRELDSSLEDNTAQLATTILSHYARVKPQLSHINTFIMLPSSPRQLIAGQRHKNLWAHVYEHTPLSKNIPDFCSQEGKLSQLYCNKFNWHR